MKTILKLIQDQIFFAPSQIEKEQLQRTLKIIDKQAEDGPLDAAIKRLQIWRTNNIKESKKCDDRLKKTIMDEICVIEDVLRILKDPEKYRITSGGW